MNLKHASGFPEPRGQTGTMVAVTGGDVGSPSVIRNLVLSLILALGAGFPAWAQTSSQQELSTPYVSDDGKPTQAVGSEPSALRAFFSMMVVLGLVGGGLWALKKYGPKRLPMGSGGKRLRVEESLPLGDRRFVSIVKADGEEFLLALSPQGITLLARLDGVSTAPPADFDAALAREVDLSQGPIAIRDMERMIQGGQS